MMIFLSGTVKHCSVFHSPFSQRHALFLNLNSVPFVLVKSLSKSDTKLWKLQDFLFLFCRNEFGKIYDHMTSTVVDCFNPLFIVT